VGRSHPLGLRPSFPARVACLALLCLASCSASGEGASAAAPGAAPPASAGAAGDGFSDRLCTPAFCWQAPRLGASTLGAVHTVVDGDDEIVFAVGAGGTMLRRRGDGWSVAVSPTTKTLHGVFAIAKDDVWAVGETGTIVHYDGKAVSIVNAPIASTLRGVWAAARDDAWAIGDDGIAIRWDGKEWKEAGRTDDEMHAVWGAARGDAWFVGGTENQHTIAHWDGRRLDTTHGSLSGAGLYAVHGAAADDVWAAGEYGQILHYDGSAWSDARQAREVERFVSIHATSSGVVWAGSAGALYSMNGAGGALVPRPFADGPAATALGMGGASDGTWVVGAGGVVRNIASDRSYRDELVPEVLAKVAIADATHAVGIFHVGSTASVRVFDGTAWAEIATNPDPKAAALDVGMANDGTFVVLRDSYVGDEPSVASIYRDGKLEALPPLPSERARWLSPAIVGTSARDLFVGHAHWNGVAWTAVTVPEGSDGSVAAVVADAPGSLWFVGSRHDDQAGWYRPWFGRVVAGTMKPEDPPVDRGFSPTSIADAGGGSLLVAGTLTDYTRPREAGFVYYPSEVAIFRVKGASWTREELPGVTSEYDGVRRAVVGARAGRAFVALDTATGAAANGYAFEGRGGAWKPMGFPASKVLAVTLTDTSTWIGAEGLLESR